MVAGGGGLEEHEGVEQILRMEDGGGAVHVAAHLDAVDLSTFDPKAPPKKTDAFWEIVNASVPPDQLSFQGRKRHKKRKEYT